MSDKVNVYLISDTDHYYAAGPGHKLVLGFNDPIPDFVEENGILHGAIEMLIQKVDPQKKHLVVVPVNKEDTLEVAPLTKFTYSNPLFKYTGVAQDNDPRLQPKPVPDVVDFDIESTGTDVQKDRIVELAMVKHRGKMLVDEFVIRVNPGVNIPAGASAIHGITDEDVRGLDGLKMYASEIHNFIKGCTLSGYNIMRFDVPMLYNELERNGIVWDYKAHAYIDVFRAYKSVYPDNLQGAYKRLFNEEFDAAHSATADIKASRRILDQLNLDKTLEELTLLSNFDSPLLDLNGKFAYKDGKIIVNFGTKCKGQPAEENHSFLKWMLTQDFSSDVKAICNQILNIKK